MMEAIRQYSVEPGFSAPVDHWSFAMKKDEWDGVSSGMGGDFGMGVSYYQTDDNLRVTYVEKSSPAGRAGIRRGWKIIKINGSTNVGHANRQQVSTNVYNSPSTSFTFIKPDNSTVDVSLRAGGYQESPVFLDSVYTIGGKKIGYLVFNSFMGDTTEAYKRFNNIFNQFAAQNVKELIVDLRYNGGGYVSVQEKLANYLVPSGANGALMMKQQFNDKLSEYNETTNFKKLGSLNLSKIIFIVSKKTASASELLINSLKPYIDVKLVGPTNTHGKPVGFFPYPVLDWYIFPVSFRTVNKNGEGNYFNGMVPDSKASDGIDKDWGDLDEASLAAAVRQIAGGTFRSQASQEFRATPVLDETNKTFDQHSFKGSIDTRRIK
jgi:C-terminal processing protease CtpA/Prc